MCNQFELQSRGTSKPVYASRHLTRKHKKLHNRNENIPPAVYMLLTADRGTWQAMFPKQQRKTQNVIIYFHSDRLQPKHHEYAIRDAPLCHYCTSHDILQLCLFLFSSGRCTNVISKFAIACIGRKL